MFWRALGAELKEQFLTPDKLVHYARVCVNLALIVGAAWFANWLIGRVVRRLLRRGGLANEARARTLLPLIRSIVGYAVLFGALVLALRALGVDYTAILAGAGVVGLAVGFGAQTLVRDFISGFFLLYEGLIAAGDYIVLGDIAGEVERIGLRVTHVRAFDGALHIIPNGELTRFGNMNRGFMRAIVTVDIAYEQEPGKGLEVAGRAAADWYRERSEVALEPPQVQGIVNFGASGLTIRVVCKVKPLQHWQAERELRLRLKREFDTFGVEIPSPRQTVYLRQ
uniref:Mechanosensitive ion channel family protein n=1 Tax=candidate division WOR-3 bacterium TaxID=2052148 RepID=A0A7C4GGW5_UNCW3